MGRALQRILPFAVFMSFIGAEELLRLLSRKGFIQLPPTDLLYLYPVKVLVTGTLLAVLWKHFNEVSFRDLADWRTLLTSIGAGVIVFVLWINMDWLLPFQKPVPGYDPTAISDPTLQTAMTIVRIFGATVIVPIMEELFWRSFLIRYLVEPDFERVPVGTFTWPSFLITAALFGVEHQFIIAGIMAGILYAILLYRTKSVAACIVSHGVTNFLLGIYVINTGLWQFW